MGAASAHEGHDHGTPPLVAQRVLPRVEASSTEFELLATAENGTLTIWLDRYAGNEPVAGAEIEVESGNAKARAEALGEGVYRAVLPALRTVGSHDLVFSVTTGNDADLLAGRLIVAEPAAVPSGKRQPALLWGGAAVAALVAGALFFRRRAAATVAMLTLLFIGMPSGEAHEGHDHGTAAPVAGNGEVPQRLADGSVFVPKPSQRALGLRTELAAIGTHAAAIELSGRIAADPNAAGRVQAAFAGRIQPGPNGLPLLGQRVAKGEVLAWLAPVAAGVDRGAARAQVADLDAQLATVEKRLMRYRDLKDFVAKRDLEATEYEYSGLQRRRAAVMAGVDGREPLVAPVAGVLARGNVVAGQIVDARELVFEIVDPKRLAVEAMAFDTGAIRGFASAEASGPGGERLSLRFVGAGRALLEQALPLLFRIEGETALPLGTPVKVLARSADSRQGVRLPAAAVARGSGDEATVWLHEQAERFVARRVTAVPVDAGHVLVTRGLTGGERVLVSGASSLAQVK
jgi:hypothetical protein